MDNDSKQILCVVNLDKRETQRNPDHGKRRLHAYFWHTDPRASSIWDLYRCSFPNWSHIQLVDLEMSSLKKCSAIQHSAYSFGPHSFNLLVSLARKLLLNWLYMNELDSFLIWLTEFDWIMIKWIELQLAWIGLYYWSALIWHLL